MCSQFFHKGISRLQTEELLLAAKDDGSFLVRDSESLPGAYVLCLLFQSRVHQYRILPDKEGRLSVQSEGDVTPLKFNSLSELIQAYLLRDCNNGLVYAIKKPLPPEVNEVADIDSEDEDLDLNSSLDEHFAALDDEAALGNDGADQIHTKTFKYGFLNSFARLDLSCCDGEFVEVLKYYIDCGMEQDAINIRRKHNMPEFEKLIHTAAKGLQRELDIFLLKLSLCRDLLTQNDDEGTTRPMMNGLDESASIFQHLSRKLSFCTTEVINLEKKAGEVVKEIHTDDESDGSIPCLSNPNGTLCVSPTFRRTSIIPLSTFEVKVSKAGKFPSKLTLTVDIRAGKYFAVKPSKDFLDSSNTFTHDNILQLVKNTTDRSKLDVIIEGKKKYTYHFDSAHTRENFCLQIRQMKSIHSTEQDVDQVSVFIGTWNMGKSGPDHTLRNWLKCNGAGNTLGPVLSKIPHNIYVIGTQESGLNDKDWTNTIKATLKATLMLDVDVLETCSLWGIRLVILINPQYKNIISHIQKSTVKTGIANALGNKGAVGISFQVNGTPFSFVCAHLTSGDERNSRRNQNFRDILKGLNLGPKGMESFDITHKFHHVFFFGDLNYRLSDKIDVVLKKTAERDLAYLLEKDQLRKVQFDKRAFYTFNESEISFMPTYKLHRYREGYHYDWKKIKKTGERINNPSWCDRILWHSFPGTFIENTAYGCVENLLNSDHRPVFASFTVGVASQFVQSRASLSENVSCRVIFNRIEAQVKTCCRQYFILEFYSACLADIICCESNKSFLESKIGFYSPIWSREQLPELRPLFGDQNFLEEQHILIAVTSCGADNESYGECVISLKDMFDNEPHQFDSVLTHNGEETGRIKGEMRVTLASSTKSSKNRKTYELVALDTEYHDPEEWLPDTPFFDKRTEPIGSSNRSFSPLPTPRNVLNSDDVFVNNIISNSGSDSDSHWSNTSGPVIIPINGMTGSSSPVAPSRRPKPIMGQSSLQAAQRQVMPVVSTTNPVIVKSLDSPPILLGGVSSNVPPTSSAPPSYVNIPKFQTPPPLPRKTKPSIIDKLEKKPAYAELKKPKTTTDWLTGLGLEEYIKAFHIKGWETVAKVIDLTTADLLKLGVRNSDHWNRILQSIQEMKVKD